MIPADLIIVGAGPAGLSAALEAVARGLSVVVLDENPSPGGRIWQGLEARAAAEGLAPPGSEHPIPVPAMPLDQDDAVGLGVIRAFRASAADARFRASVWAIEPDGTVYWTEDGRSRKARGERILLATGTSERPLPIPGWTLPGVMTVGAAQIALKTGGLVPAGTTWIAGQGPLLLLYVIQALKAGGTIAGVLDLSDGLAPLRAMRHLSIRSLPDIRKGLAWRRDIAATGIRWLSASDLRAEGEGSLKRITFRTGPLTRIEPTDLLLLHDGVLPSVQITRALGCAHVWDDAQRCWKPRLDAWGMTSLDRVLVAGDGGGVAGALAAAVSGRLAALQVAHTLGRIALGERDVTAAGLRAERARHAAARPFLDALYAPRAPVIADATLVCRCEEVTAGEIRAAVRNGCLGLNQLKAYTRVGMGPCQGRICGAVAAEVVAQARGVPVGDVEPLRTRFPAKPLTLGELAAVNDGWAPTTAMPSG